MKMHSVDTKDIDLEFLKNEFERFRADISGMKDRLSANATDALDHISTYLNGGGLSSRVSNLEAEFEALTDKMRMLGKEGVGRLESNVSQRPIASVAIAFGVGLLAAQLLRR